MKVISRNKLCSSIDFTKIVFYQSMMLARNIDHFGQLLPRRRLVGELTFHSWLFEEKSNQTSSSKILIENLTLSSERKVSVGAKTFLKDRRVFSKSFRLL